MDCPICHQPMENLGQIVTNNGKADTEWQAYTHTTYHCTLDDVWFITEIPVELQPPETAPMEAPPDPQPLSNPTQP